MSKSLAISAQNVWKLFGSDPHKYLATQARGKSFDEIRADGYIAGVKDVSIDVFDGEILVIMGLSGLENQHSSDVFLACTTLQVVKSSSRDRILWSSLKKSLLRCVVKKWGWYFNLLASCPTLDGFGEYCLSPRNAGTRSS